MSGVVLHPVLLHAIANYWFVPAPPESHHLFGAGFLFVGVVLLIEPLAGEVWYRNKLRASIWPGLAIFMGWGLLVVAMLDSKGRVIHASVGILVMAAGWMELRYRFGEVSRSAADFVVVPALLAAAFEMGVIHARGVMVTAVGHVFLGAITAAMAATRVYQARDQLSFAKAEMMGGLVTTLGLVLLIFQP
ncbi:MAG: hypothetical protein AB7T32_14010 [Dehalococcoidia bacterium]